MAFSPLLPINPQGNVFMKKIIFAAAVGICTLPVMSAGAASTPLLGNTQSANLPALPLLPLQLESSLAVPGFGKGSSPTLPGLNLPGLLTLAPTFTNPGKGNGNAKAGTELDLLGTSPQTALSADYTVHQNGQFSANYNFIGSDAGFGAKNHPNPTTTVLPMGGTIVTAYDDEGAGKTLEAGLTYTSPTP
jgi:hypothetical protein